MTAVHASRIRTFGLVSRRIVIAGEDVSQPVLSVCSQQPSGHHNILLRASGGAADNNQCVDVMITLCHLAVVSVPENSCSVKGILPTREADAPRMYALSRRLKELCTGKPMFNSKRP